MLMNSVRVWNRGRESTGQGTRRDVLGLEFGIGDGRVRGRVLEGTY